MTFHCRAAAGTPAAARPASIRRVTTATARSLASLAAGLLAGAAGFAWAVTALLAVGLLAVTQLGGPAFLSAAWVTRRLATAERHRVGWVLGRPLDQRYSLPAPGTVRERVARVARQPATWRDLAWLVVAFPLGLGPAPSPAWWSPRCPGRDDRAQALALGRAQPRGAVPAAERVHDHAGGPGGARRPRAAVAAGRGPRWVRAARPRGGRAARALLAPGEHRRLVGGRPARGKPLPGGRRAGRRAAPDRARPARRRPGPARRPGDDPGDGRARARRATGAAAGRLLAEARRAADDALAELRDLVRGIHPPILTDRGLYGALAALAARLPVAVDGARSTCPAGYPRRWSRRPTSWSPKALANAGKHAERHGLRVDVAHAGGPLRGDVTDDGRGGADPAGHRPRRAAPAGRGARRHVSVTSPTGGPTACTRSCHAHRDRRRPAAAAGRAGAAAHRTGHEVVAAVDNADALLAAVGEHRPDLAMVDVRLPPSFRDEGLRAALRVRGGGPGLPVLVLSQYVERAYAAELLADGRRRRRLPAQGPGHRARRVPRRGATGWRPAAP